MRRVSQHVLLLTIILLTAVPALAQDLTISSGEPVIVEITDAEGVTLIYEAAAPESLDITARSLDGTLDTTLEIYDAEGNLLAFNDDAVDTPEGFVATDSQIVGAALSQGIYTIQVKSFTGEETGEAEILISSSGAATTFSAIEAVGKVLFTSEPLKLYLNGEDPIDLVYPASGDETISVYVIGIDDDDNPIDPTLEILNPAGEQIGFNDDLNEDSFNPGIEGLNLSASGVYTIRVETYQNSEGGDVEVQLVVGAGGGTTDETTLSIGLTLNNALTEDEVITFTFEGEAGQIITLRVLATDPASPEQDLVMRLYDPDGELLAEDDDSGAGEGLGERDPAIVSFELPENGTYEVEVDSLFDISGDFSVTLEAG